MIRTRKLFRRKATALVFLLLCITLTIHAQAPDAVNYQFVVRNASGAVVGNTDVSIRISILQGEITGTPVYTETDTVTTNAYGVANIQVGRGFPATAGSFASINWANGPYFLQTEVDPEGGTNYVIAGTSQLMSVPYALYAKTAGTVTETDPVWNAARWNYYTRDSMQTSGFAQLHFNNLTHKPTTVAGYGITDAMTTAHPSNGITSDNILNWNTAYSWEDHEGLYRPISYVPAWGEITSNPFQFTNPTANQMIRYNSVAAKWENWTPDYITGYTETDPEWSVASTNYYTKANMQASGSSELHFGNLTNKPTTVAGYGITDAMTTAHPANGITSDNILNWNDAYSWGDHEGLYRPINYVPAWGEITSNPFLFNNPTAYQMIRYNSTSAKWENWTPNFLTSESDPIWTSASSSYYTKTNMQTSGEAQLHYNNLTSNPFLFTNPSNNQMIRYNSTSSKWENWTPNFITGYTETDPIWSASSSNYYTKANMQGNGTSQLHFNNLTNKPNTVAGYGITDAMTTAHPANSITQGNINNWNTAYSNRVTSVTASSPLASSGGSTPNISLNTVTVPKGGTGLQSLPANKILVGNNDSNILSPSNLHWDNSNSRLGIGNTSPAAPLDVLISNITIPAAIFKNTNTSTTPGEGSAIKAWGNGTSAAIAESGGGAFCGSKWGVVGRSTNESSTRAGGYFYSVCSTGCSKPSSYGWVGGYLGTLNYSGYGNGSWNTAKGFDGKKVVISAQMAPESLLSDYGVGTLVNGKCYISIDQNFTDNVVINDKYPLKVFIQLEGECNGVFVTNKTTKGFEVIELGGGKSNVHFSWHIVANQSDDGDNQNTEVIGTRFAQAYDPNELIINQ